MKKTLLTTVFMAATFSIPAAAETVLDWRWLKGTTWYVPASGLPAYLYVPDQNQLIPVKDQTVYMITGYRNGYFWGRTAAKLSSGEISCSSLVGSVTPEGSVYLTFNTFPYMEGAEPTVGIGKMTIKTGKWSMLNQMSTSSGSVQVGHWAYMLQTYPGASSWSSLPGVGMSVPDFIAPCMDAAPTTP
jgi:hypothetical protein